MASNHYLVNWDLVRLAFFGKNAVDDNHLGSNISIHVVGKSRALTIEGIYINESMLPTYFIIEDLKRACLEYKSFDLL